MLKERDTDGRRASRRPDLAFLLVRRRTDGDFSDRVGRPNLRAVAGCSRPRGNQLVPPPALIRRGSTLSSAYRVPYPRLRPEASYLQVSYEDYAGEPEWGPRSTTTYLTSGRSAADSAGTLVSWRLTGIRKIPEDPSARARCTRTRTRQVCRAKAIV